MKKSIGEAERDAEKEVIRRLAAGEMLSCVLDIAIDMEVFRKIKGESLPIRQISALWELPVSSSRLLAQILCVMGLLVHRNGMISNSPLAESHLALNKKDIYWLYPSFRFRPGRWDVRRKLSQPHVLNWYEIRDKNRGISFNFYADERTHSRRIEWGEALARQYDFSGHSMLLDVGGASGGWCIGIRKIYPGLRCVIFDIPQATWIIKHMIEESGQAKNIEIVSGSFFTDNLPAGADVILLANVLHDWSERDDKIILEKVYKALPAGGVALVSEFYFEDDWSGPIEAVMQAFSVLGSEGQSGWQPSYKEMEDLLREEGFVNPERRKNLVLARKL